MGWLISILTGGVVEKFTGPLLAAYQAKLNATTNADKLDAERDIARIEAARDIAVVEASRAWSATSVGRWLIVVPFGLWWSAIYLVQIVNGLAGTGFVIIDVPVHINAMAQVLVPAIVIADAGAFAFRRR